MRLFVIVKTNATEERVTQRDDTHYVVAVKALPQEGKANRAVTKALARFLVTAPSALTLHSGAKGKQKVFDWTIL